MKKIIFAVAALVAALSCSKSNIDTPKTGDKPYDGPFTIVKASADVATKTQFGPKDGNSYPLYWSNGDAINVNGHSSTAIAINPDNASSATFTLPTELEYPYAAATPAAVVKGFIGHSVEDTPDTILVSLPAVQTYKAGTYDPNAGLMLGYATEGEVPFHNAMAFLNIKVQGGTDGDAIKSVRVRANYDVKGTDNLYGRQAMSGDFKAFVSQTGVSVAAVINDSQSVTLDCGSGVAQGTEMIIAIPALNYTKGINIFIVDAGNHYQEIVSNKPFVAEAGKIYPTEIQFNGVGTYQGPGLYTANDWNALSIQYTELGDCTEFDDENGVINVYEDITAEILQRFGGSKGGVQNSDFSKKMEGNNHTVTAIDNNVPLFTYISGEVRNITFAGNKTSFSSTAGWGTAQIALNLNDGAVIENVTANFNVTAVPVATNAVTYYFGMFRDIQEGAVVRNCVQKSNFTIDYTGVTTQDLYVLPFAYSNDGTVSDCSNQGNVTFLQDPGQKAIVAPIHRNTRVLSNFVNTGNFTVISSNGGAVAGIAIEAGGYIKDCVHGALDGENPDLTKGTISFDACPSADGKTYTIGGIAAHGDRGSSNCGRYYGCTNFGSLTLTNTTGKRIYRSTLGGIVGNVRYGAYGTEKITTFDNVYNTIDGCVNKGYIKYYEPTTEATSGTAVPVFLGGILGVSLNVNGTSSGAIILTKTTTELAGNYIVIRTNCTNNGTLELASANPCPSGNQSGARLNYVGGIAGFTYGIGNSSSTTASNAHYAVVRGTQNGVIRLGSSVTGNTAAGGLVGGCCYTKCEQAKVDNVTYEATSLQTKGVAPKYRGMIGATIGYVVKYSDVTTVVNANLTDNTGLFCSASIEDYTYKGYAGVTSKTSVHKTSTTETPKLTVKAGSLYNGVEVTTGDIYGGGNKEVK